MLGMRSKGRGKGRGYRRRRNRRDGNVWPTSKNDIVCPSMRLEEVLDSNTIKRNVLKV